MLNPTSLLAAIFRCQDTDTLNVVASGFVDEGLCVQVETRPHNDGVVMTVLVLDEETGEEKERKRILISAAEFSN